MFASNFTSHITHRRLPNTLYAQVGVENGGSGASRHQLVAQLFDGFQEAVAQARGALRGGQPAAKGVAIGRPVRTLEEGAAAAPTVHRRRTSRPPCAPPEPT